MVPNKLQPHREKTHLYGANPQTHRTGETDGILAADLPEQGLYFHPHLSVLLQNISTTQQVRDKTTYHLPLHSTVVTGPPAYRESLDYFLSLNVCSS